MSWLDQVIGSISPEWGYKRETFRQGLIQLRDYDAASHGRLNANWAATNESAETVDRRSRNIIRARARDLEHNSDMMNEVVRAFRRNVIGAGYTLQAATEQDTLNTKIERYWKIWCKKENCDITGTQSFNQMLRMAVTRKKIDGGILFVKCYTGGGLLPFKLQAIEVDELDEVQMIPQKAENKVVGGIEYNPFNHPEGFYIKQYKIDGMLDFESKYIPAKDVIFLYTKNRPSQVREISDVSPTITRIRDTNEYMTAVAVKERVLACLSVFIKKQYPTTTGDVGRDRNNNVNSNEPRISYKGKTVTPGMITEMNMGDEAQFLNPAGQAADTAEFIRIQQRLIGGGQGLSYEATARDMSKTNYSSARSAILEDELTYVEEKELLLDDFMNEVYETFIISGYLAGIFTMPGFWDRKNSYMAHTWVSAPKRWIDPAKEANANKIAMEKGQKTFKQIAAENGKDWREQIDDIAEVLEYAKERGVDLESVIFGKTDQIADSGKEEEDDDEEDKS